MPINPSTDPAVYNTGSLKCIRAGSLAQEGRWFFSSPFLILCVFYFAGQWSKDPAPSAISTHPLCRHTLPSFSPPTLVTLFTCKYPEMKWVTFVVHAGAFPSTAHNLPPHVSLFSFLHSLLAWFHPTSFFHPHLLKFHPHPAVNLTPTALSLSSPPLISLSPALPRQLLLPISEVVDCWITL